MRIYHGGGKMREKLRMYQTNWRVFKATENRDIGRTGRKTGEWTPDREEEFLRRFDELLTLPDKWAQK